MWLAGANGSLGRPRGELALLLLASLFVVFALVIAVIGRPGDGVGGLADQPSSWS